MSKNPNDEIRERLGTSAMGAVPATDQEFAEQVADAPRVQAEESLDPYGSGNFQDPKNRDTGAAAGQSDKTGWGNQGNWGNEGYFQGFESNNEDRRKNGEPMPDLTEKAHETTKQRDQE